MTDAVVPRWSVVVVVPAHDEAALLPRCLASIAAASAEVGDRALVRVFVVADACTDATGAVAWAHGAEVVEVDHRNVGTARASGVAAALGASSMAPAQHTWLASTDADTVVPPDWLDHQLDQADAGFVAVAGVVRVDSFVDHPMGTESVFAARYAIEPGVAHTHVHGANIGARADAYLRAGGWEALGLAEEHDLWRRLRAAGERCLATTTLWVTTSGRAKGRADGGFADLLAGLVEGS
ncbi:glycosyltransferase family 2 protein [soil metagenome]